MGSAHVQPHCQNDCAPRPTVASFAIDCSEACHTPTGVSTGCELGYGGHLEAAGDQLRGHPVEPRTTRDTGSVTIAPSYSPDSIPWWRSRAAPPPISRSG